MEERLDYIVKRGCDKGGLSQDTGASGNTEKGRRDGVGRGGGWWIGHSVSTLIVVTNTNKTEVSTHVLLCCATEL